MGVLTFLAERAAGMGLLGAAFRRIRGALSSFNGTGPKWNKFLGNLQTGELEDG